MGFLEILKKKNQVECFTTPSHSQSFFIFSKLRNFYKYDISETEAQNPEAALFCAQKSAAKIYKTQSTHFLTNGSTSGIIAAVLACTKKHEDLRVPPRPLRERVGVRGEKFLIWDKAHRCHNSSVILVGAQPVFYEYEFDKDWGVYTIPKLNQIEEILKKEKIKALIITSPTYEGVVCDVEKISKLCKKYKTYLIVDEAHGALYPFCDKLPKSAIYQGADFVIHSLHKTAGGLNPTALLHCNLKDIDIQSALALISTTSPSYPMLASIEKNINFLNSKKGRAKILELIENIENMKKNLPNLEFFKGDSTKILTKHPELSGFELSKILFEKYKIEDEISNQKSVMFLTGLGTSAKKLAGLEKMLKKINIS